MYLPRIPGTRYVVQERINTQNRARRTGHIKPGIYYTVRYIILLVSLVRPGMNTQNRAYKTGHILHYTPRIRPGMNTQNLAHKTGHIPHCMVYYTPRIRPGMNTQNRAHKTGHTKPGIYHTVRYIILLV